MKSFRQMIRNCFEGNSFSVCSVVVTFDNYIISGSSDKTVRIWSFFKRKQEVVLQGHTNWVNSVAVTSNNRYIVSGSSDKTIRVWNFLEKHKKMF